MSKQSLVKKFGRLYYLFYRIIHPCKISVQKGNRVELDKVFLNHCEIRITGSGNKLVVAPGFTRLSHCKITVCGTDCEVVIGNYNNFHLSAFNVIGDGCRLIFGNGNTLRDNTYIEVSEGCRVVIGNDSLFADDVQVRVSDWHSVLDKDTGKRINPSKDVVLGDRIWIANSATIHKGVVLSNDTIVGAKAFVTSGTYPPNSILAGVPAKVVKQNVCWDSELLPMDGRQ